MTTITKYICDLCGKEFENEDECHQHELLEKINRYPNDVAFFGLNKNVLPFDKIISGSCEVWGIYVKNEKVIPLIDEISAFLRRISPWSDDSGSNRKTIGLYLYDEERFRWYLPADKIKELKKEMKEYGVDA